MLIQTGTGGKVVQDYLRRHTLVDTTEIERVKEVRGQLWVSNQAQKDGSNFRCLLASTRVRNVGLTFYDWQGASANFISDAEVREYIVDFHDSGCLLHWLNGRETVADSRHAVVHAPGQDVRLRVEASRALVLHLQQGFVENALKLRLGHWRPMHDWACRIRLHDGPGRALQSLCRWAATDLDSDVSVLKSAPRAAGHIERAIRSLFIDCLEQLWPGIPSNDPDCGPRMLRQIEEWIEANLEEPIGVEEMARVANVGVRAVQKAFRRDRGCTPTMALTRRRMQRARALLLHPLPDTTVTSAAITVGLCHLGRFATGYRALFDESPSETLARGRSGRRTTELMK